MHVAVLCLSLLSVVGTGRSALPARPNVKFRQNGQRAAQQKKRTPVLYYDAVFRCRAPNNALPAVPLFCNNTQQLGNSTWSHSASPGVPSIRLPPRHEPAGSPDSAAPVSRAADRGPHLARRRNGNQHLVCRQRPQQVSQRCAFLTPVLQY